MDLSPFPYQGPLRPEQVQGRDELLADLTRRITARKVTAVLGPRRFGKTSVLRRLAADLGEVATVWVDLYEVTSLADVAVRFDDALAAAGATFARHASALAAAVSLNLGLVKVELSGPARSRPDPAIALHSLLDILVQTAVRTPTMLVVDEFSSISRVNGAAGALRTALQRHYTDLGIVFAGSHPSMMRSLFTDRPQPFYGQADLLEIPALTATAVEDLVRDGFATTGRGAGPLPALIREFTRGHPQRTMQLADACWSATAAGATADELAWSAGLETVRAGADDGMERLFSGLAAGERAVLRSVARSGSVYGSEARLLDLSAGTAAHARGALLERGDLVSTPAGLQVVDPVLADWLRRRFPL